ncbi:MAG: hypothetical protein GX862_05200 [Leucobacter sp.]|jgi:hypothetical protein|nr:hypothetical protein [Leucobacter sp.]
MSRPVFALVVIAVIAVALLAMWLGWRARSRRDATIRTSEQAPTGALIAEFTRVLYVSTTPTGEPLVRVAVRGLRYRGPADVWVYSDGVTLQVDGEDPVHLAAAQVQGSGAAARRVGKAVEHQGLSLLIWHPVDAATNSGQGSALESSFRLQDKAEQHRFTQAIEELRAAAPDRSGAQAYTNAASQEDEK